MAAEQERDLPPEVDSDGDESFAPPNRRGMRTGYTTGACATAAAKAATQALLAQQAVDRVTIHLPAGVDATFELQDCEVALDHCGCGVIKDAGDDPDVTHGAEIRALVRWTDAPGLHLRGGEGCRGRDAARDLASRSEGRPSTRCRAA